MLTTERLKIFTLTDDEMRTFISVQTDAEMIQAYNEMLDGSVNHPENREFYAIWSIALYDGTSVGDLCFKGIDNDGTIEIGYGIYDGYQNKGYATEAVKAVLEWAKSQPNVEKIEAEALEENLPSRRVLEKCGFVKNGIMGEEGPRYILK